LIKTATYRR